MKDKSAPLKIAYASYILYLLSLFVPLLPILAVILTYIFENDAETYLKSHYQYLIRTFWIGVLYFLIAGITVFILIGFILIPLCIIWLIIRLVKGLKSLMHQEPILNPKTWLF